MLKLNKGWLIGGCLMLGKALAGGPEITPVAELPTPGVSVYGLGGNGWTAIGDVLAPVLGQPNSFFFIDPQFYYHSAQSYTGSAGVGHRWLTENAGILGAYVFGDFNHSDGGQEFWFVSPGLERLGRIVDLSINAYIPVSTQRINTGTEFADQAGDSSQVVFAGHNQYDTLVDTFTSTGYGGDAQIGFHVPFFRNSEVFLGGYYFAPKDTDSIGGGAVRVQIPVNRYLSVIASEAYDSEYHNTLKAGLTVWFGGRETGYGFNGDLAERLVDPIQRSLIAVAGGSETGEPVVSDFENTGQTALELSNISFFVPAAAPVPSADLTAVQGDGTYENPYQGMTQDNVDNGNAQGNRNFYVNSGTYNAVYGMTDPDYIILNNDQVYGRQNYFKEAAQGDNRALINFTSGGFAIPDSDTYDSITGLRLMGMNASTHAGIWIDHEASPLDQTVTITNTDVSAFGDGIDLLNADNNLLTVNINDSLITQNNGEGELFASEGVTGGVGVANTNTGFLHLNVDSSTISNNDKTITGNFINAAGGLAIINEGNDMRLGIHSSNLSDNVTTLNDSGASVIGGLAVLNGGNNMTLSVQNSSISGNTATLNDSGAEATGGLAVLNNDGMTLTVQGSSLSGNTSTLNESFGDVVGGLAVLNGDNMTLTVKSSNLSDNTNTLNNNSGAYVVGGLAILNDGDDMSLAINGSSLFGNTATLDDSSATAVGGLAVFNDSNGMMLTVQGSSLAGNTTILKDGSLAEEIGGLALENDGDDMTLAIKGSSLSGNNATLNESYATVVGGLAVVNDGDNMMLAVKDSSLSGNTTMLNNSNVFLVGGLALYNIGDDDMALNVRGSNLSGNTTTLNDSQAVVIGGLAVLNADSNDMTFDVQGSNISGNMVSLNDNSYADIVGGLAVSNSYNSNMLLDVRSSNLSGNTISVDGSYEFIVAGGIAAIDMSDSSSLTINVDHSVLAFNTNGIAVDGAADVNVQRSIIAWNTDYGLSAISNAQITVTDPIYFNDKVNLGTGGVINFPGLTPSSGQHVICLPFGNCFVVTPG